MFFSVRLSEISKDDVSTIFHCEVWLEGVRLSPAMV
jgi:hypothetical protein